jgi:hypothetical protein
MVNRNWVNGKWLLAPVAKPQHQHCPQFISYFKTLTPAIPISRLGLRCTTSDRPNITPASNVFVASVCSAKKVLGDYLLGGRGAFGRRLLAVTFVETIDSARRVNQFLFSSKEWMTS